MRLISRTSSPTHLVWHPRLQTPCHADFLRPHRSAFQWFWRRSRKSSLQFVMKFGGDPWTTAEAHWVKKKNGPSCIISSVYLCLCVFLILWWRATLSVRGGQFVSVVWELTNHRCVSEVLAIPCVLIHETSWFLVPTSNFSVCQAELHQTGIQAVAVSHGCFLYESGYGARSRSGS